MKFIKLQLLFTPFMLFLFFIELTVAQEYDFEIPEEEAAKIEFNGNLDAKWAVSQTNKNSPFYRLQFFGLENIENYLSWYQLDFYFNSDFHHDKVDLIMRTFTQYTSENKVDLSLFELFGSLNISSRLVLSVGKRRYYWGKGYAFNPVGYVNAEKDPENPDLALSGKNSISIIYNYSFNSSMIQNLSLSAIVLPGNAELLDKYSVLNNTSIALKLYLLLQNIDLDFMIHAGKNKPHRYGMDLSTNLRENIEVHGEVNYAIDEDINFVQNNVIQLKKTEGFSYLLGLRYLNDLNITFIAEYYHSDQGLTFAEYQTYLDYLNTSLNGADLNSISQLKSNMSNNFHSKTIMRDYCYFKASLPEPFEWLYSSISIFTIYNLDDNSFILSPQIAYKPFTNSEIILWPTYFFGDDNSEYGNKQFQTKIELWFRFYF